MSDGPNRNEPLLPGLEIGGSKRQLAAGDSPTGIVRRQRLTVDPAVGAVAIQSHIQEALAKWAGLCCRARGVGFGGLVDRRSGRIGCSHPVGV